MLLFFTHYSPGEGDIVDAMRTGFLGCDADMLQGNYIAWSIKSCLTIDIKTEELYCKKHFTVDLQIIKRMRYKLIAAMFCKLGRRYT